MAAAIVSDITDIPQATKIHHTRPFRADNYGNINPDIVEPKYLFLFSFLHI